MDPKQISLITRIWLVGNPIFSLAYENIEGGIVYTDLTGFRPDPSDFLDNTKYKAEIIFQSEKDHNDVDQWVLRNVNVTKRGRIEKFVYIR